jgi:hypothetical protein
MHSLSNEIRANSSVRKATHSIGVVVTAIFLLPFSAQKSLVKSKIPQIHQNKANKNEI